MRGYWPSPSFQTSDPRVAALSLDGRGIWFSLLDAADGRGSVPLHGMPAERVILALAGRNTFEASVRKGWQEVTDVHLATVADDRIVLFVPECDVALPTRDDAPVERREPRASVPAAPASLREAERRLRALWSAHRPRLDTPSARLAWANSKAGQDFIRRERGRGVLEVTHEWVLSHAQGRGGDAQVPAQGDAQGDAQVRPSPSHSPSGEKREDSKKELSLPPQNTRETHAQGDAQVPAQGDAQVSPHHHKPRGNEGGREDEGAKPVETKQGWKTPTELGESIAELLRKVPSSKFRATYDPGTLVRFGELAEGVGISWSHKHRQDVHLGHWRIFADWIARGDTPGETGGKGGLAWMTRRKPDLAYLAEDGKLSRHFDEAMEWFKSVRAATKAPATATDAREATADDEAPTLTPDEIKARLKDASAAIRRGPEPGKSRPNSTTAGVEILPPSPLTPLS